MKDDTTRDLEERILSGLWISGAQEDLVDADAVETVYAAAARLFDADRAEEALALFRSLCLVRPFDVRCVAGFADSLYAVEEYAEALKAYEALSSLTSDGDGRAVYCRALCLLRLNRKEEALCLLEDSKDALAGASSDLKSACDGIAAVLRS